VIIMRPTTPGQPEPTGTFPMDHTTVAVGAALAG
jgi:hypothetical protein